VFDELDVVRLRGDRPEDGLRAGAEGTIVHVFTRPNTAYEVEFADEDGQTVAMLPLTEDQFDLVWSVRAGRRVASRAA
jgi:hypothetical protein